MNELNIFEPGICTSPDIYVEVLKLTQGYSGKYLDLGAGQGNLTRLLLEQGHSQVYACDKHPEYFKVAGLRSQSCDLDHKNLPYAESFFDVVICTEAIEHLENPRHLLREIHRVLNTKGRLIISTPNVLSLRSRLSLLFRGYSSYLKKLPHEECTMHITTVSRLDFLIMFKEIGFRPVRFIYTRGVIPKTHLYWQAIFPFLKGELFSDTIIILAEKA